MELVKRFCMETSRKNITGDREECGRIILKWVLWIWAMRMGAGPIRSTAVFSDGFGISGRIVPSRNALIFFVIIHKLGPYRKWHLSPTFRASTNILYEGESKENLKFVIKHRNFASLACKLVSVLQTACRMACRWQHSADARTPPQFQYKDGCPT